MTDQGALERILSKLEGVRSTKTGYEARCPAHHDRVASLSLSTGDKAAVVLHCHAGCEPSVIVSAVGMTMSDLAGAPFVEARYEYRYEGGELAYVVERWANPKTFRAVPGLPEPARRVLYNQPALSYARAAGQTVYVVEGEKDVETLRSRGLIGTTNVGGAGKWLPHYADALADLDVVVLADNDEPGLRHARMVYASIRDRAKSSTIARPLYGKDITELLAAGYPVDHVEPVPEDAPLASVLASAVRPVRVRWAWNRYVPMGTMTIIEGDPGDGKSTLTCDLIARWSTGVPMPDGSGHDGPWPTMLISIEDDPAATIVPRLMAAGARLDHVVLVTGGQTPELPFNLGVDLDALARQVRQYGIRIIVLDPLMAFMPETTNGLIDAEVRRALGPLQTLARSLDVAVVVVRHLTKSATRALYAGSGSIGIIGAARAAFLVRPDPHNPDQRIIAPTKTNLVKRPPALAYHFEDDEKYEVARVRWDGVVQLDADTLFEGKSSEEIRDRDRAAGWLENALDGTYMTWRDVIAQGKTNGFRQRTLERARDEVLKCAVNPSVGNVVMLGYFWYRADQWPFVEHDPEEVLSLSTDSDHYTGSHVSPVSPAFPYGEAGETGETRHSPESRPVDREASLLARERACEECGSRDAAVFLAPHWVIRCRAHDPRRWTK